MGFLGVRREYYRYRALDRSHRLLHVYVYELVSAMVDIHANLVASIDLELN